MVLSVQLYTVRDVYSRDPQGTLRSLKEMGLTHVELAGQWESPDFAKWSKDMSLKVSGSHLGLDTLEKRWDEVLKAHETLGCRDLIVPHIDGNYWNKNMAEFAERMGALGEKGKPEGFKVGFHNHAMEIESGRIHEFFAKAGENVHPQFDLGWIYAAGQDPSSYIQKYGDRILSVHMKDLSRAAGHKDQIAGESDMNWPTIVKHLETEGVPFGTIEMDNPPNEAISDVAKYYRYFKSLGLA